MISAEEEHEEIDSGKRFGQFQKKFSESFIPPPPLTSSSHDRSYTSFHPSPPPVMSCHSFGALPPPPPPPPPPPRTAPPPPLLMQYSHHYSKPLVLSESMEAGNRLEDLTLQSGMFGRSTRSLVVNAAEPASSPDDQTEYEELSPFCEQQAYTGFSFGGRSGGRSGVRSEWRSMVKVKKPSFEVQQEALDFSGIKIRERVPFASSPTPTPCSVAEPTAYTAGTTWLSSGGSETGLSGFYFSGSVEEGFPGTSLVKSFGKKRRPEGTLFGAGPAQSELATDGGVPQPVFNSGLFSSKSRRPSACRSQHNLYQFIDPSSESQNNSEFFLHVPQHRTP